MKWKQTSSEIRYYQSDTDDFVHSKNREYCLPDDYAWLDERLVRRILAAAVYRAAWIFSFFYVRLFRRIKIKNRRALRQCRKSGCFLYGNHTQPVGDVFTPAYICGRQRIYTVAGQENLGLPVIGRLLPYLGALPVPDTLPQMKQFLEAVHRRIDEKCCVVIYPEAHVWPYYTEIRPFPLTSFRFPVECDAPAFCMTTTYQKKRHGKEPQITVYIDGPFYPDKKLRKKEAQKKLHDEIFSCMQRRSLHSSYEYIRYREEKHP